MQYYFQVFINFELDKLIIVLICIVNVQNNDIGTMLSY